MPKKKPDFLDRLKIILTDTRKVSPYLTKELRLSEGAANRILNRQKLPDERLMRPLHYLENCSNSWLMSGKGTPFHVTTWDTEEETRDHIMEALTTYMKEDGEPARDMYVVAGARLCAVVISSPATHEWLDLEETFYSREIDVIGGAVTLDLVQMMIAEGLPVRDIKLTTLNDDIVKAIRTGQMGTFLLFGSETFNVAGLLSNAPDFPMQLRLAAQTKAAYTVTRATKAKPSTK